MKISEFEGAKSSNPYKNPENVAVKKNERLNEKTSDEFEDEEFGDIDKYMDAYLESKNENVGNKETIIAKDANDSLDEEFNYDEIDRILNMKYKGSGTKRKFTDENSLMSLNSTASSNKSKKFVM